MQKLKNRIFSVKKCDPGVCFTVYVSLNSCKKRWNTPGGIRFTLHLPSFIAKTHSHSYELALLPVTKSSSDIILLGDLALLCFCQSSNTWTAQAVDSKVFGGKWPFLASVTLGVDDNWSVLLSYFCVSRPGAGSFHQQLVWSKGLKQKSTTARADWKQTQARAIYACAHAIQVGAYVALLS